MCQIIDVKILLLVNKALNGLGTRYISSWSFGLLTVTEVKTKHEEAALSFYAPHICKKLPETLRSAPTLYLHFIKLNY